MYTTVLWSKLDSNLCPENFILFIVMSWVNTIQVTQQKMQLTKKCLVWY